MFRRLDGANFSMRSSRYNRKSRLGNCPFKLWIHLVVAEELLGNQVLFVEGMKVRPWPDADFRDRPAQLWRARRGSWNGAGDGRNHNVLRSGFVFSRIGILDPHDVSRTLYQSVLKAPSSTDERPVAPAGEFN